MADKNSDAFNFIDAYRELRPNEDRPIIDARAAAFKKQTKALDTRAKVRSVCCAAFQLTTSEEGLDWFIQPLVDADEHFSFLRDHAEAARLASLLLRHDIQGGDRETALLAVVASVEGVRTPVDPKLLSEAQAAIVDARLTFGQDTSVSNAALVGEDKVTALKQTFGADQVVALVQALAAGTKSAIGRATAVLEDERRKTRRLAEELDMLWWYIGGWSALLGCPRSDLGAKKAPLIFGADLASFVQTDIGPYGARALLHRLLESESGKTISLTDAVDALEPSDLEKLTNPGALDTPELFPISLAIRLAQQNGAGNWHVAFEKATKLKATRKFSKHHLASQVYNERVSLKGG